MARGKILFALLLACARQCGAAFSFDVPKKKPSFVSDAWIKEAELKHGRVAMLALPSLVALSSAYPGVDPVGWLNARPVGDQLLFYSFAGVLESFNLRRIDKGLCLKKEEVPGKVLPFVPPVGEIYSGAEVVAGRAAMIACFLFLFRSFVAALR